MMEIVSFNLKKFRESNNYKQSDVIGKLQTNRTSYAAYEEKRCLPPADFLVRFSEFSGFNINDFLTKKLYL